MGAAIAPLMLIGGIAGTAMNAMGQYSAMEAQSANAAYQAQVATNNAVIAGRNAEMETQSGEVQASNQEMKTRAAVGAAMASEGASGVDVGSGSFVSSRGALGELGMQDALTIRSNAAKRAYAYQTQQSNFTAQAGLDTAESKQASSTAPLTAMGSLLSGASSVGSNYLRFMQNSPSLV